MRSRVVLFAFVFVFLILVGAVVAGYLLPKQWHVEAHTSVQASPAAIHPFVAEPRRWPQWFPWSQAKSPGIVYGFSGPDSGVGAVLTWHSQELGEGTLTLTKSDPASGVAYDLVITGFGDHPIHGEIALEASNGATTVTVREGGELGTNPIARLFRGVIEGKLGHEHHGALERLKALSEGRTPPPEAPPK